MKPFREHHLFQLLQLHDENSTPLDRLMHQYFRSHSALGSKDRAFIAENAYALVRWRGLLDHLLQGKANWEKRFAKLHSIQSNSKDPVSVYSDKFPLHVCVSFPKFLFEKIISSLGEKEGVKFCIASNFSAPTFVRVNRLKISRDTLLSLWKKEGYAVSPCKHSPHGIIFHKKMNFFTLEEFKKGYFEVQDEGSQLLAALVQAKPGEQFLDYCAGSGGKALAVAPQMEGKGQIYLHDIRRSALTEAKKRLNRAGIQNVQIVHEKSAPLAKLKKKMDWVLVDAPCSGTGTLRRNPDMKWKLSPKMIDRIVGEQRIIFEKALSYVKPGGSIVYGTCSILKEENEWQKEHFLKTYPIEMSNAPFNSITTKEGMDGFYGVVFNRKKD